MRCYANSSAPGTMCYWKGHCDALVPEDAELSQEAVTRRSGDLTHACRRAIEAAVDGCSEDVPGLAHWWSNCLHLRWMLWAMCRGDDDAGPDGFDWVMQVRHRGCRMSDFSTWAGAMHWQNECVSWVARVCESRAGLVRGESEQLQILSVLARAPQRPGFA